MKRWIEATKVVQKLVVVTWVHNDPLDDYLFPRARCIEGKLLKHRYVKWSKDGRPNIVEVSPEKMKHKLRLFEEEMRAKNTAVLGCIRLFFRKYSTFANLINSALDRVFMFDVNSMLQTAQNRDQTPLIEANLSAIAAFNSFAQSRNIRVVFLVTWDEQSKVRDQIIRGLKARSIPYFDFIEFLRKKNAPDISALHWQTDEHPNVHGNALLADAIEAWIKANGGVR